MDRAERSGHYFMNVKDIIDMAFGELDGNMVNFRLIRIVLYLLARQLRILERRVEVSVPIGIMESGSSLTITEVKVHGITKKVTSTRNEKQMPEYASESKYSGKSRKGPTRMMEGSDSFESREYGKETGKDKKGKESRLRKERKEGGRTHEDGYSSSSEESEFSSKQSKDKKERKEGKRDQEGKAGRPGKGIEESKDHKGAGIDSRDDKKSKEDKKSKGVKDKRGKEDKADEGDIETKSDKGRKQGKVSKKKQPGDKRKRADSYEQPDESPTPMASVEDLETRYEKLLIVTSGSSEDREGSGPQLSIVTQQEFKQLAELVDGLCTRFKIGDSLDAQLMDELHRSTSYTEAIAALQLSARLEATEKLLRRMVAAIGTIARETPGLNIDDEMKAILETHEEIAMKEIEKAKKKMLSKKGKGIQTDDLEQLTGAKEQEETTTQTPTEAKSQGGLRRDCVTYIDLDSELRKLSNEMMKQVTTITNQNIETAERAYKIASGLETRLDSSLDVTPRMVTLEAQVAAYADQINALDTGLTSQICHEHAQNVHHFGSKWNQFQRDGRYNCHMINYQEQLIQMQHELEMGLEAMAEALANAQGADTIAVAELNTNFIHLQNEQEAMTWQQRDLKQSHHILENDLASLWKQIELLRDTKSDRDEVTDALRDKAGIKDLNGLVSLEQFDAVRGDLEKRIATAYDKFNNQEIIWQKAIDDLLRELSEKADLVQLYGLRDEINKYLNIMRQRLKIMADIVGEPKAAIVTKKLFRDTACISCSSPATMDLEEPDVPPALPKLPDKNKSGIEKADDKIQIKGDGDHKICYPGLPIPHPPHPKAHICMRYCGGSHTLIPSGPPKVPPSTIITPLDREVAIEQGADGKMYQVEKTPCLACNTPLSTEAPAAPAPRIKNDIAVQQPPVMQESRAVGETVHPSTNSSVPKPLTGTDTPPAINEII